MTDTVHTDTHIAATAHEMQRRLSRIDPAGVEPRVRAEGGHP